MKAWKAIIKFYEEYPTPDQIPEPIKAALVQFFLYGFIVGGGVMLAVFILFVKH